VKVALQRPFVVHVTRTSEHARPHGVSGDSPVPVRLDLDDQGLLGRCQAGKQCQQ
jgi:hypothetical protein